MTPVGALRHVPVDISLVCATHRVLRDAIRAGSFREDLDYRVNGLTLTLPPLRERNDNRSMVSKVVETEAGDGVPIGVSEAVLEFFERYHWPGNVRQLQNVIRLAVALLDEGETEILPHHRAEDLFAAHPMDDAESDRSATRQPPIERVDRRGRSLDEIELEAIGAVMRELGGNVSAAAWRLGISRNTRYRKIGRMS